MTPTPRAIERAMELRRRIASRPSSAMFWGKFARVNHADLFARVFFLLLEALWPSATAEKKVPCAGVPPHVLLGNRKRLLVDVDRALSPCSCDLRDPVVTILLMLLNSNRSCRRTQIHRLATIRRHES